jgi:hypothetical protein
VCIVNCMWFVYFVIGVCAASGCVVLYVQYLGYLAMYQQQWDEAVSRLDGEVCASGSASKKGFARECREASIFVQGGSARARAAAAAAETLLICRTNEHCRELVGAVANWFLWIVALLAALFLVIAVVLRHLSRTADVEYLNARSIPLTHRGRDVDPYYGSRGYGVQQHAVPLALAFDPYLGGGGGGAGGGPAALDYYGGQNYGRGAEQGSGHPMALRRRDGRWD